MKFALGNDWPELTPESEKTLDEFWDEQGRKRGTRPPVFGLPTERLLSLWADIVAAADSAKAGQVVEGREKVPALWLRVAHQKLVTDIPKRAVEFDEQRAHIERWALRSPRKVAGARQNRPTGTDS